jgi:hypothetical protein
MDLDIKWITINFGDISPLPKDLALQVRELNPSYIISQSKFQDLPGISREAALLLIQMHPPLVRGKNYHCICGQRILNLATPSLEKTDQVPVGLLPLRLPKEKLLEIIKAEFLLNQIAYSSRHGLHDLVAAMEGTEKEQLRELSPALGSNLSSCAKFLDISRQTMHKLRGRS